MRRFVLGVVVGMLLTPALATGALLLGWISLDAKAPPSTWETSFAHVALERAAARSPRLTNPYPATDENLKAGMKTFRDGCAGCHGEPTQTSDYGASFHPHVPQFAVHPPQKPDWQLYWIIKNGVRFSGMSAWDGQWRTNSEEHIWKVALFLSRLETLPPAVAEEWHKKPAP